MLSVKRHLLKCRRWLDKRGGNAFPVLWHSEGCAPGHEHRLIAAAERQLSVKVTLHQDHLLITEPVQQIEV